MNSRSIILIAHNLRSCHNVGSLLRTADGLGISQIFLTGYTPYPLRKDDDRLPHLSRKITNQIHKTALGAESTFNWRHNPDITSVIDGLHRDSYTVAALEQTIASIPLQGFASPQKIALIVGREVDGVEPEVLALTDLQIEIPMFGTKESYNVVQAAAMALYHLTFF